LKNTSMFDKQRETLVEGYRTDGLCIFDRLVIESISPLEGDRKCFRMVGGVLVERTVKDVLPALQTNFDGVSYYNRLNSRFYVRMVN
jgi:hypothetical protein